MTRIVVKNTVDMRLMTMQLYKMRNCDKAIGEGEQDKPALAAGRTLRDSSSFLKTDEDNNILSVEPTYDDDDDLPTAEGPTWVCPWASHGRGEDCTGDWSFGHQQSARTLRLRTLLLLLGRRV